MNNQQICASKQTSQGEEEQKIFRASEESKLSYGRQHKELVEIRDPMVAPQDCDVHQSVGVLELQNSDLRLRSTVLSWNFPILMTIREDPFKNCRSTISEKWKATRTSPKSSRSRRCRNHVGHRPGHLGDQGIRTKRVSVPNGDHRVLGSHHCHGSEE